MPAESKIMKTRKLKDGSEVPELDKPVTLHVKTKCPEKWLLIDMETDEVYVGSAIGPLHWDKVEEE